MEQNCSIRLYHSLESFFLYLYDKAYNQGSFPSQPIAGRGKTERKGKYLTCQLWFSGSWAGFMLDLVVADSAAAQRLHWGGSTWKTNKPPLSEAVACTNAEPSPWKAKCAPTQPTAPGSLPCVILKGVLFCFNTIMLFYTIVNSGKIRPNVQPPNASGNNWHSSNIILLALTAPYPVFNIFSPPTPNLPWISNGEICWIFGSYLLLKSQKGTRAGNRNLTQSHVRRTLPYRNINILYSLEEIL